MILDSEQTYASYVNLDHRQDRLIRLLPILEQAGLGFAVRQPGCLPGHVPFAQPLPQLKCIRGQTPGAEGCAFSQYQVMKEAFWRGKHALVMEDDIVFCKDFKSRIPIITEFLEEHPWDVFWFGATFHLDPPVWHKSDLGKDVEVTDHPRILRTYGIWSTYCYFVNHASIPKVLTLHEENLHRSVGIDTTFIEIGQQLLSYCFVPGCVKQYDNESDIGSGITVFSGFSDLGPYWWADNMNEFDPTTFDWAEAR